MRTILTFTLADICAKSMSPGKEFNTLAELHVYDGRVFHQGNPVTLADGTVLTTKKYSFTIVRLTFGEESNKLVAYLGATSRKLSAPLAVLVQSSSAAGKSALMNAVLDFMPDDPETVEAYRERHAGAATAYWNTLAGSTIR